MLHSALPANIRLDKKGSPGANALAYFENLLITAVKSFITLAPDVFLDDSLSRHPLVELARTVELVQILERKRDKLDRLSKEGVC